MRRRRSHPVLDDPVENVYAEYMAHIIRQIPSSERLDLLVGPGNAQASFYFRSPIDGAINTNLYNNLLSPRIADVGSAYGVRQATTKGSTFVNDYDEVYTRIRFALSTADRTALSLLDAKVTPSIAMLQPLWNAWVLADGRFETPPVSPLSDDVESALIEMTAVLQTRWVNPEVIPILRADPSYPYVHLEQFDRIFSRIPSSVPSTMRRAILDVYAAQGAGGALTARVSAANQTLRQTRHAIQTPTADNGGQPLSGSGERVPGATFRPTEAEDLVRQLGRSPVETLHYTNRVQRVDDEASVTTLLVHASDDRELPITAHHFFSYGHPDGRRDSIFDQPFAGSEYVVDVKVKNPTLHPMMEVSPLPLDLLTGRGWLDAEPIRAAIVNEGQSDVTGFVFDGGAPPYDFGEQGDFGFIHTLVLSQFLELTLIFEDCDAPRVERYFRRHDGEPANFLDIPLPDPELGIYSIDVRRRDATCTEIVLAPKPPGFIPPGPEITNSLCFLVAVGVCYPVA
ncbi:MAG: hypothetical protein AAGE94_09725 [Acidobacteriota bacterium]